MRTSGWHGRLATALALGATLAVAAPAGAATTVRLAGGRTSLKLNGKTFRAAGVKVSAARPAKSAGGTITLPIAGGSIDPATAKGMVDHRGGLTFTMGAGKVTLARPMINTAKGTLAGRIGRTSSTIATVKGGKVSRSGFATTLTGAKLALSKRGAQTLNTAFGITSFKTGQSLGTATIASQPAEIAVTSGTIGLAFTPTTIGALGQLRVQPAAIAPATFDAATGSLSFPVSAGTLSARSFFGTVQSRGGLSLTKAGTPPVELTLPIATLSPSPTLSVTYSGANVAIADLTLTSAPSVDARARTIRVPSANVRLNALAATTLNGLLGTTGFQAGAEIATASLSAKAR